MNVTEPYGTPPQYLKEWEISSNHLCGNVYGEHCGYLLYNSQKDATLNGKKLGFYDVYCTAENKIRKIGAASTWTGCSPKFCPIRKMIEEDKTMARKMQFDAAIAKDMKSASQDGFADNIKMIDISEIKPSIDNFYELSGIELLADDIEREGLKHNLVVSKDKDGDGYWLKSGHRRLEAIKLLIESGRTGGTKLPCYIDGEKTRAESKLDLIMLNATQRRYTDAETMREYAELKKTFKELEDEGKPLKGKMRDNIAAVLQVSPAQVGKIENIRHNAAPEVEKAVESGKMSISTANEIAKLAPEKQAEIIEKKPDISHKEVKEMQSAEKDEPKKAVSSPAPADDYEDEFDEDEDDFDDYEPKKPAPKAASPSAPQSSKSSGTLELTLSFTEASDLLEFFKNNIFGDEYEDRLSGVIFRLNSCIVKFCSEGKMEN